MSLDLQRHKIPAVLFRCCWVCLKHASAHSVAIYCMVMLPAHVCSFPANLSSHNLSADAIDHCRLPVNHKPKGVPCIRLLTIFLFEHTTHAPGDEAVQLVAPASTQMSNPLGQMLCCGANSAQALSFSAPYLCDQWLYTYSWS